MRYLILAAGVGKRMGSALAGLPKCMIDIDGEPLIARLLRQIRQFDAAPEIHVLLGYRSETIAPLLEGCRIILNPFFDITGINASLWFARESFDRALLFMHGARDGIHGTRVVNQRPRRATRTMTAVSKRTSARDTAASGSRSIAR